MTRRSATVGCAITAPLMFVAALVACWDRDWHAPDPTTLVLLWLLGSGLGIGIALRAEVGRLAVHRSDWLVVGTATRVTTLAACGLGLLTSSFGAVGVAMALTEVRHLVLASILGSLWMATYPLHATVWLQVFVRTVAVGVDGVRVGRRALHFSEIRGVHARGRALEIESKSGARWIRLLPTWAVASTVAERITSRLADVAGSSHPLARAGRPLAAWKRALLSPDYRAAAVSSEEAARVLVAGDASPDERIGAALLLAKAGDAARVRVAAAACVDRRVRVALEQVADDRLDEATLEAAARADVS